MNLAYRNISARISQANIAVEDVSCFTELVFAYAISKKLALPSTLDSDYQNYYTTHHSDTVRALLSEINEDVVLNIRIAAEYVRAFYSIRLSAAYPSNILFVNSENSFFDSACKVDQYLSPSSIQCLNRYKRQAMDVSNLISLAMDSK